jgi:hypothetical protein
MSISEITDAAIRCGASAHFPYLRDVLICGPVGAAKKTLAVMGLGLDAQKRGIVQDVRDAAGRTWGSISSTQDGRASVRLDYLLGSGSDR